MLESWNGVNVLTARGGEGRSLKKRVFSLVVIWKRQLSGFVIEAPP